jgi:hypothetical protein
MATLEYVLDITLSGLSIMLEFVLMHEGLMAVELDLLVNLT